MRVNLVDVMDFAPTQRKYTPEGYLVVPAQIGRTGVQQYRARELGLDGGDKIVRLYRPHEEVFAPETLASFAGKPIADNHPPEGVNADNYTDVNVGNVGPLRAAGKYMLSDAFEVRDTKTIRKVQDGKVQLSCGYDFELDMTSGTSPDGEAYDGVQRKIRGNHVAIVDLARGGVGCRIADNQKEETTMRVTIKDATGVKGVTIAGIKFDVDAKDAENVQDAVDRHHKALMDCMGAHDELKKHCADMESQLKAHELKHNEESEKSAKKAGDDAATIETLKAEVAALKAVDHDALVEERTKVVADAKTLLGADFDAKGKTNAQIRTAAIEKVVSVEGPAKNVAKAVIGDSEPAKATETSIRTAFDAVIGLGAKAVTAAVDAAVQLEQSKRITGSAGGQDGALKPEVIGGRAEWMEKVRAGKREAAA